MATAFFKLAAAVGLPNQPEGELRNCKSPGELRALEVDSPIEKSESPPVLVCCRVSSYCGGAFYFLRHSGH